MAIVSPRGTQYTSPAVPLVWSDESEHRRKIAEGTERALEGKIRSTGTVTLTASSATTTLSDIRIGSQSVILFMPTTANAAAELATMYVSARTDESATITHANNAQTDRTFGYAILG